MSALLFKVADTFLTDALDWAAYDCMRVVARHEIYCEYQLFFEVPVAVGFEFIKLVDTVQASLLISLY